VPGDVLAGCPGGSASSLVSQDANGLSAPRPHLFVHSCSEGFLLNPTPGLQTGEDFIIIAIAVRRIICDFELNFFMKLFREHFGCEHFEMTVSTNLDLQIL